jgi:uncharacterized protein (DUF58 family)
VSTADRTSDKRLPPELIAKIKAIQIRTRHRVTDVLAGDYESAFKGRGMEFEEVRAYHPGDDVRHIDWNVTARMREPYVKVHKEERELTVMLLVDASSSGVFGTATRTKQEAVAEAAAILAYTAVKSNDRVGLIVFTDKVERYIPPKKGTGHVWRVIREVLGHRAGGRTNLDAALEFLGKIARRRVVAFVLSDFVGIDAGSDQMRVIARRHDLTAVTVTDQREVRLPAIGLVEFEDAETGERVLVDTHSKAVREHFERAWAASRTETAERLRASGVARIDLATDQSPVEPIVRFFRGL